MSAPDVTFQSVASVLNGYCRTVHELVGDLALQIEWEDLGDQAAGRYDGTRRLVTINSAAPLATQYWFVHQVWTLCTFGEAAVPTATRCRHLRPVD
jgi:hypothetical protein